MRLFYASGSLIPSDRANSVHVMKMCQAFAKNGCDVTLFAKHGGRENPFDFYGVDSIFSYILSPFNKGIFRLVNQAYQFLKFPKPDICYGRDPWLLAWMSLFCPVVLELHEVPYGLQGRVVKWLFFKNKTKLIVCISKSLLSDVLTFLGASSEERFLVAHDGADLHGNVTVSILKGDKPSVGYVGSLLPGKGAEVLVDLAARMPEISFHIVGGTQRQIDELRIREKGGDVHYHGHVSHGDLNKYISGFDVVVAPYQKDMSLRTGVNISRWISPLKLFEYMAAKKPIICSDLSVLREVMEHEKNCLLVAPDNLDEWQNAITRFVNDEALKVRLSDQALADLKEHYTWDKRAKNILGAVTKALM